MNEPKLTENFVSGGNILKYSLALGAIVTVGIGIFLYFSKKDDPNPKQDDPDPKQDDPDPKRPAPPTIDPKEPNPETIQKDSKAAQAFQKANQLEKEMNVDEKQKAIAVVENQLITQKQIYNSQIENAQKEAKDKILELEQPSTAEKQRLEKQLEDMKAEQERIQAELKKEREQAQKNIKDSEIQKQVIEDLKTELEQKTKQYNSEINDAKEKADKQYNDLVETSKTKEKELNDQLLNLQKNNETIQAQADAIKKEKDAEINKLNNEITEAKKQLKDATDALNNQIKDLSDQKASEKAKLIAKSNEAIADKEKQIQALEASEEKSRQDLEEVQNRLNAKIQEFQNQKSKDEKTIKGYKQALEEAKEEVEEVSNNLRRKVEANEKAIQQLTDEKNQAIANRDSQIKAMMSELGRLKDEKETDKGKIAALEIELYNLQVAAAQERDKSTRQQEVKRTLKDTEEQFNEGVKEIKEKEKLMVEFMKANEEFLEKPRERIIDTSNNKPIKIVDVKAAEKLRAERRQKLDSQKLKIEEENKSKTTSVPATKQKASVGQEAVEQEVAVDYSSY